MVNILFWNYEAKFKKHDQDSRSQTSICISLLDCIHDMKQRFSKLYKETQVQAFKLGRNIKVQDLRSQSQNLYLFTVEYFVIYIMKPHHEMVPHHKMVGIVLTMSIHVSLCCPCSSGFIVHPNFTKLHTVCTCSERRYVDVWQIAISHGSAVKVAITKNRTSLSLVYWSHFSSDFDETWNFTHTVPSESWHLGWVHGLRFCGQGHQNRKTVVD